MTETATNLPFFRFPPFPDPPPGATIPVFSEFKPAGIQIVVDADSGEVERDGRGIPTVKLASSHSLTDAERAKNQSKKMRKTAVGPGGTLIRLTWYEEWEELEHSRRAVVNPALNRIDRLHQAAADFKSGRPWPPPQTHYNPMHIWDTWRLYLGLISGIHPEPKKNKKQQAELSDEENDSEEEQGDDQEGTPKVVVVDDPESQRLQEARRAQREQPPRELTEEDSLRKERFDEAREAQKNLFLSDPEYAVRVFFSSHWRDKGYIHDEKKCLEGPILISFFLRYIVRSRVFPEEEAALQRAIALCELAKKELPATWVLGRSIPDNFSRGLEGLNGMMTNGAFGHGILFSPLDEEAAEDSSIEDEQPDTKKRKLDPAADALQDMCKDEPTVQVIDPDHIDHVSAAHADAVADNVDQNGMDVDASGWGAPADVPSDGGWGSNAWTADDNPSTGDGWGTTADADGGWFMAPKNELFQFLGPTTLPFTHTTGIVERSTRRIERVVRPPPAGALPPTKGTGTHSQTEVVEEELEARLGYAVLSPWVKVGNHVASDLVPPEILFDSRGAVVVPTLTKSDLMNHGIANSQRTPPEELERDGPHQPFDPTKDAVRVLLEPALLDMFEQHVGMGICATWVQIARKETPGDDVRNAAPAEWSGTKKTKKGKATETARGAPGKNGEPTQWWYMEQVAFTVTSFHTDRYYADQE